MVAQIDRAYRQAGLGRTLVRLASYALFEGRPLTTRGRWMNPLVFALLAIQKRLPQLRPVRHPVFIVGTGRSGTTLLGVVLSLHPEVGFLNEPRAIWHSVFGGEDVSGNFTGGPARYRLGAADAEPRVARAAHRIFGSYQFWLRRRRVVDKTPEIVFRIPFVRAIFPEARFVHIVRNGWDVAASIASWSERHEQRVGAELHDWWGRNRRKWDLLVEQLLARDGELGELHPVAASLSDQRQMAAVEWIVTCREGLRHAAGDPRSIYTLRYEDLLAEPEAELGRLLEFCRLRPDRGLLDYARRVLRPATAHPRCELHAALRGPFLDTLRSLGYPAS